MERSAMRGPARRYEPGFRAARSIRATRYTPNALGHQIIELHLRLRAFQPARVAHDLLMGVAVAVEIDVRFAVPFRIGNELMGFSAAQKLLGNATLLPDHERRAF